MHVRTALRIRERVPNIPATDSARPRIGFVLTVWALLAASSAAPTLAAPDYWDPRLNDLGVCYIEADVPAGTWYWKLVSGVFEDENESGGTHNIYYRIDGRIRMSAEDDQLSDGTALFG